MLTQAGQEATKALSSLLQRLPSSRLLLSYLAKLCSLLTRNAHSLLSCLRPCTRPLADPGHQAVDRDQCQPGTFAALADPVARRAVVERLAQLVLFDPFADQAPVGWLTAAARFVVSDCQTQILRLVFVEQLVRAGQISQCEHRIVVRPSDASPDAAERAAWRRRSSSLIAVCCARWKPAERSPPISFGQTSA